MKYGISTILYLNIDKTLGRDFLKLPWQFGFEFWCPSELATFDPKFNTEELLNGKVYCYYFDVVMYEYLPLCRL